MAEKVCVGAVIGAFGVRGEVRVKTFTARPEDLDAYGPVVTEDGRTLDLKVSRSLKGDLIAARIGGIDDRDAADALKGTRLYVDRAALPAPEPEEYYHADLIGLDVVDASDRLIGVVHAVHDFGAGDVLEILMPTMRQPVMLPFTHEIVPEVDLERRRIVVDVEAASLAAGPAPDDGEAER